MKKVDPFVYPPENFAMVAQGVRAAPQRISRTTVCFHTIRNLETIHD